MTLPLSNTFETHLADETAISAANSGDGNAGDAFDAVSVGGAGVAVYDTGQRYTGSYAGRFQQDGTNGNFLQWASSSVGSVTQMFGRFYIYVAAQPADSFWIIVPLLTGTRNGIVRWNASGTIDVFDSTLGLAQSGSQTVPLNQWVRFEWRLVCHASAGSFEFKMFRGDSITPVETVTLSGANTLGSSNTIEIGQAVGFATGLTWWLDEIEVNSTEYPGPVERPNLLFRPVFRSRGG